MFFNRPNSIAFWRSQALAMFSTLTLLGLGCSGTEPAAPPNLEQTTSGQTASEVLEQMVAAYEQSDRYSDRATYNLETVRRTEGVKREKLLFDLSLALERPNKIRFRYQQMYPRSRRKVSFEIVSDGKLVHSLAGELPDQVHETQAPEKLTPENFISEPYVRETVLKVSLENIYPQLSMLLATGDYKLVFPNDAKPRFLEQQKLNGRDCHLVALESAEGQRVLWIDAETHALRRMKLPLEAQLATLDPSDKYSHYSVWIDYVEPVLNAELDSITFVQDIPADLRRVKEFVLPPPPGPLAILGQPVANFSFTTLAGEEVTPASLAGKLVLMEFWSKTCPPCRKHTPLLDQVYRELKDSEDFLFYAVNANLEDTSNDAVAKLFKSWGGSIPLLRDLQETSYTKLEIAAYPHTIIIDRHGNLQMYQPGMHTHAEPLLKAVRQLLAGEDLAAAAHAKYAKIVAEYEKQLDAVSIKNVSLVDSVSPPEVRKASFPDTDTTSPSEE